MSKWTDRTDRNHRPSGVALLELLVVVAVVGILATIITPNVLCSLEKARVSRSFTDMVKARDTVERYLFTQGGPPATLDEAYNSGESQVPVPNLWYCGAIGDGNAGHGNDTCDFVDEENPGNSTGTAGAMPGVEFIIRTPGRDMAPGCQQVDFIYSTCCGGRPLVIKTGEWSGSLPGESGQGGGGGGGGGGPP